MVVITCVILIEVLVDLKTAACDRFFYYENIMQYIGLLFIKMVHNAGTNFEFVLQEKLNFEIGYT